MFKRIGRVWYGLVFGSPFFVFALFVGICGGVVGVLVDIDHLPMLWGFQGSRALHAPLAIGAGVVGIYSIARLGRLLAQTVSLGRKKDGEHPQ